MEDMEDTVEITEEEVPQTEAYLVDRVKDLEAKFEAQISAATINAKKVYALKQVLRKHNISFDVDEANLKDLAMDTNGKVAGVFNYDPPNVQMGKTSFKNTQAKTQEKNLSSLNESDIKEMTLDQINENWDQISAMLTSK